MPIITKSTYKPPFFLFNGHLETIIPTFFRKVDEIQYERETFTTSDQDFIDLDWLRQDSKQLVILFHGLEGNSRKGYIKGMAKIFFHNGWDILAWNFRSCGGTMNKALRMYHHGEIEDTTEILASISQKYDKIVLVGFSMGGSVILKYLGTNGSKVIPQISKAVAISVPCSLQDSALQLNKSFNRVYRRRFIRRLLKKMELKSIDFPDYIKFDRQQRIKTFEQFDNIFSAPMHGFKDAAELYRNGSAINYLNGIRTPTLLINALNDPMLTPSCFPVELAREHPYLHLEIPARGGHVGFLDHTLKSSWVEQRALQFVNDSSNEI